MMMLNNDYQLTRCERKVSKFKRIAMNMILYLVMIFHNAAVIFDERIVAWKQITSSMNEFRGASDHVFAQLYAKLAIQMH